MSTARFVLAAWGANLRTALSARAAFAIQALFMALNNFLFLTFWAVFFARFRSVKGWELSDVALLYGVAAVAFGLAVTLAGGTMDVSRRVADGTLDTWLLRPRAAWLQAATSRMRLSGWGDVGSGYLLFFLVAGADVPRLVVFTAGALVGAVVLTAFFLAANSAAFWASRTEEASQQGVNAILTFSLYPPVLFHGKVRLLLHAVVPAAFVSWLPASLVRHFTWAEAGELVLGAGAVVVVAAWAWRVGLARYESGNLIGSG